MLKIPASEEEHLVYTSNLSKEEKKTLLKSIAASKPAIDLEHFVLNVCEESGFSKEKCFSPLKVLFNLFISYDQIELEVDQMLEDFFQALDDFEKLTEKNKKDLLGFVSKGLSIESFQVSAKALRVKIQHDSVFLKSEVFTDIRSIFPSETVSNKPIASTIIHNLKITSFKNGEENIIYFALDFDDLEQLIEQLVRAKEKHKTLSNALEETGINSI